MEAGGQAKGGFLRVLNRGHGTKCKRRNAKGEMQIVRVRRSTGGQGAQLTGKVLNWRARCSTGGARPSTDGQGAQLAGQGTQPAGKVLNSRGKALNWRGKVLNWRGKVLNWRGKALNWRGMVLNSRQA